MVSPRWGWTEFPFCTGAHAPAYAAHDYVAGAVAPLGLAALYRFTSYDVQCTMSCALC